MWRTVLALVLTGAAAYPAAVTSRRAADLKQRVASLIDQLGSPDYQTREAAQRRLLEIGEPAMAQLRRARQYPDAEIVQRAEHILGQIQRNHAQRELAGTSCSGRFVKRPVSQVLTALCRSTGNPFWLPKDFWQAGRAEPLVSITLDKVAFWEAVDAVCRQANLRPSLHNRERALSLRRSPYVRLPTAYSGAFRVTCTRIVVMRDLQEASSRMQVRMGIAWEPRLVPIQLGVDRRPALAQDDRGNDLVPRGAEGQIRCPTGGATNIAQSVELRLVVPPRGARTIRRLRGAFSVLMPGRFTTIVFDQPAAGPVKTQARDDVVVRLVEFRTNAPDQWLVSVDIRYDTPGEQHESYRSWHQANRCRLRRRKDGKLFGPEGGYNTTVRREGLIGFQYIFTDMKGKPADYDLVYRLPTLILRQRVTYELKDLALP